MVSSETQPSCTHRIYSESSTLCLAMWHAHDDVRANSLRTPRYALRGRAVDIYTRTLTYACTVESTRDYTRARARAYMYLRTTRALSYRWSGMVTATRYIATAKPY